MIIIQSRNVISRGLTGEEYLKYIRIVKQKGQSVKYSSDWRVEPIGAFEKNMLIFCAYHDDIPGDSDIWIEEKRALNCTGYALMCRTKFFVSPDSFTEIKRYVKY